MRSPDSVPERPRRPIFVHFRPFRAIQPAAFGADIDTVNSYFVNSYFVNRYLVNRHPAKSRRP
jgi:hypothetical protein